METFSKVDFIYRFQSRPCPLAAPLAPGPAEVRTGKGVRPSHGRGISSQHRELLPPLQLLGESLGN